MSITMGDVGRFKFLAHKVMPLVFDESLSYYEFLCKVIAKLNEVIDNENEQNSVLEDFSVQMDEWNEEMLAKYTEFTNRIDGMITEFETQVTQGQTEFETEMGERADAFEADMQEQWDEFFERYLQTLGVVQETGSSTTDVMSQKAVTDEIGKISEPYYINYLNYPYAIVHYYYDASGNQVSSDTNNYINIPISEINGKKIYVTFSSKTGNPSVRICEYNGTTFIQRQLINTDGQSVTLNSNTTNLILNIDDGPSSYFSNLSVNDTIRTAKDIVARKEVNNISEEYTVNYIGETYPIVNYYYSANGSRTSTTNEYTDILINNILNRKIKISYTSKTGGPNVRICEYSNGIFTQRQTANSINEEITLSDNTDTIRLSIDLGPNSYFTDLSITSTVNIANDTESRNELTVLNNNEKYPYTYAGNSIKPRNYFAIETKQVEKPIRGQGLACFGNIGVKAQYQSVAPYDLSNFTVFDMDTLKTIKENIVPTDSVGVGELHCNTISFGVEYYSASDNLPLLYCSGNEVRGLWVYRIDNDYNFTCVQKITFPPIEDMPTYKPVSAVDRIAKNIVVSCNSTNASPFYGTAAGGSYENNTQTYYTFRLPLLNEGSEVQMTMNSDLIKSFSLPAITVRQGFQCEGGIIYHLFGNENATLDPIIRLACIDNNEEELINVIDLNEYNITTEPEGLCVYNGKIYADYGVMKIFKFN